jgi:putative cell wall-binding protein
MPSRPRRLTISLLATLLALAVVQLGTAGAGAVDGTALVGLANQERGLEGRAPVAYDALLERISDDRARQMAATDVLAHDMTYVANQLHAAGLCFSGYGEIIASERGYPTYDPARTMAQWWASPGHHAIIVGDYNAAGGSHARSASGSAYSAMVFVKLCAVPAHATAVSRIAGTDRYGTAAAISRSSFAPGVAVAYVATGESFPDALAGAAAAAHDGGPVLLTARDVIPPATLDELTRLRPARIVVLGGPGVISDGVAATLAAKAPVDRIAGADRYATAAAISAATNAPGVAVAYVATGAAFPDALAGGAVAGRDGGPVLLATRSGIPAATATELGRLAPARIVVLGGSSVLDDAVLAALRPFATTGDVQRLAGADRYSTSVAVSRFAYGAGSETAFVTTGLAFPDGLASGPVAALVPGPVLLVAPDRLPAVVGAELARLAPSQVVILGGTGVVSDAVVGQIEALLP